MEFVNFISEYRWIFFIITESVFWISLVSFFVTRYWFGLKKFSAFAVVMIILNELTIFGLGVADFMATGKISQYQVVILIILIYTFTYGKNDFKKLDAFIERKVKQLKGEYVPPKENETADKKEDKKPKKSTTPPEEVGQPDYEHARRERVAWFKHLLIYAGFQLVFWILRVLNPPFFVDEFYDLMRTAAIIWTVVIIIDTFVSLSYTIYPRKKK